MCSPEAHVLTCVLSLCAYVCVPKADEAAERAQYLAMVPVEAKDRTLAVYQVCGAGLR
jgi:hypothetical protein